MATTAEDILVPDLQRWGVKVIFGLPGDGINGHFTEALARGTPDGRKTVANVLGDKVRQLV